METEVWLTAEFTARPGCEGEVARLMAAFAQDVRAEAGNLLFRPTTRDGYPRAWLVLEGYVDRTAFAAHLAAPHSGPFNEELVPLIEEAAASLSMLIPK